MPSAQRSAWPPASPWVWSDSWWDGDTPQSITLSVRFDSPVNGGGTLALQGVDYDVAPGCPWRYLIVDKPDGTRVAQKIPDGGRAGTIGPNGLASRGLSTFTDIGSITVGANPS